MRSLTKWTSTTSITVDNNTWFVSELWFVSKLWSDPKSDTPSMDIQNMDMNYKVIVHECSQRDTAMKQETHRAGSFKQSNKQHKTGRHRSKSAIINEHKGYPKDVFRIPSGHLLDIHAMWIVKESGKQNVIKMSIKHLKRSLQRDARRNQLSQIRKKKREEVLTQKRNLGGFLSAPVLICIIPLQNDINIQNIVSIITSIDDTATVTTSPCGILHISIPRIKQRFSIIVPPIGNVVATLDAAKAANTILFITSVACQTNSDTEKEIIDDWGKNIIVSCLAQGLPTTIFAVHNIQRLHIKKRQEYKQSVQRVISKWLPDEKVLELDTVDDCLNMLRRAGSQKQRNVFYKNIRPYLLAEEISFECNEDSLDFGTLSVTGYVRGETPLSVNNLVHIPGFGDFQMSCIKAPEDPYEITYANRKKRSHDDEMKAKKNETVILYTADLERQKTLESEYIPDPMDAEQTWPTEEELAEAAANRKKKIVKVVPKGTSEYQAAWIPDEDGESLSVYSEESEDNMSVDDAKSETDSNKDLEDDEEYETITISEAAVDEAHYDRDINMFEEKQAIEKFKVTNQPLIVVGLLPYEHKMSLLNVVLKHSNNYTLPIKSKERLVFQCGFRRFTACPIFSQHTNGNKHKYERYFHPDNTVVASMYAPVTFSPCPVLCYIENQSGELKLIATGNVLSCNPNRIVLKRVVLSGHPYKINKRSVVVRFMFFNREDIEWFKPVQLRTKYGRRGHIKECLGTHGHMKCIFNGQLKSQDTILMNLYKRVFPKWTYEPLLLTQLACHQPEVMQTE
ncbi:Pre-rRNA-processing protein TSR1-like protein [Camponotus floridanus]|uniref:Pre-rRNA-processing protein TSR1 homolog n=1 Tax=Camponotus floridanus TaxID=104421 RepID=E2AJH9_CAMFO|nr:Pre-rRNA-processing protein TSR1-like protein [Camponotus floridanus]